MAAGEAPGYTPRVILPLLCALAALAAAAAPADAPAREDYAVVEADFALLERGLADADKLAQRLFPGGLDRVDALLYDTSDLYVYTREGKYPYPVARRRGGWTVYRVAHRRRPTEREMARCAGGVGSVPEDLWTRLPRRWFACAAWGAFGRIQAGRRSDYRFEEGYLATVAHELGHLYQRHRFDEEPVMRALDRRLAATALDAGVDPKRASSEAFASWAEGAAARELYPAHWRRMKESAARGRPDDVWGHEAGRRAAVAQLEAEASP